MAIKSIHLLTGNIRANISGMEKKKEVKNLNTTRVYVVEEKTSRKYNLGKNENEEKTIFFSTS